MGGNAEMKSIIIETIPHHDQRYDTAGDYQLVFGGKMIVVTVSDTGNPDFDFLCAIHEMVEAYLCQKRGINFKMIDKFDMSHPDSDDPGSLKNAPYRKEHFAATRVERAAALELDVSWREYEEALERL
jgi:hypothetical protein